MYNPNSMDMEEKKADPLAGGREGEQLIGKQLRQLRE
jgi:hypothetical protein